MRNSNSNLRNVIHCLRGYRKPPTISPGLIQVRKLFLGGIIQGNFYAYILRIIITVHSSPLSSLSLDIKAKITGEKRRAPEGTWVLGGGIGLPCVYFLYGPKIHKGLVRKELKE